MQSSLLDESQRMIRAMLAGLMLVVAASAGSATAADADWSSARSVADLSLEDLVNLKVTSVSKKEEKLNDAAAAVFVLSNDDLRRSGAVTVADALRLVPGLQVAAIDSSDWAVSARGFNSQFANKLLVMIDGRTVYSPLFSGVYWDVQQVLLEDVDRIEVIRGPGATVWGANAVNGVINILTKSARDTQGGLLYAGAGDPLVALGGVRYGGKLGTDSYYRAYGTYQRHDNWQRSDGSQNQDAWDLQKVGFRVDQAMDNHDQLTWQGDGYWGNLANHTGDLDGFNALGRWTRRNAQESTYEVQAFFDRFSRVDSFADVSVDTADLTFQHTFVASRRNAIIWGAGYRFVGTVADHSNFFALTILDHRLQVNLFSAFVQDEFKIIPDKAFFTFGTKVEHNDFTGIEVQPSVRFVYKPAVNQTVWTAVSRAVRTPSEFEGKEFITVIEGGPIVGPGGGLFLPTAVGNPDIEAEVVLAYELGYRIQPNPRVSLDVAGFYNDYSRLVGQETVGFIPGTPLGIQARQRANTLHGESHGVEAVVTVSPTDSWRLSTSYSFLGLDLHGEPVDEAEGAETNAPAHQAVLRSSHDFHRHIALDAQLRYVSQVSLVPSYFTGDLRVSYRPTPTLELSLVGQNLFEAHHPEQASVVDGVPTIEVPRGFYGKIAWQF